MVVVTVWADARTVARRTSATTADDSPMSGLPRRGAPAVWRGPQLGRSSRELRPARCNETEGDMGRDLLATTRFGGSVERLSGTMMRTALGIIPPVPFNEPTTTAIL